MRVLVSAYACEPGRGSEPGVGWNWARQAARFNEVWVITRANNRQSIEAALLNGSITNIHFVYFDLPKWALWWKRRGHGIRPYYYIWQIGAYFVGRRLHRAVGFDLVHHLTFVNYWMPSFLAMLPVPFLLGPVGGGESARRGFWWSFSLRGKIYEVSRELRRGLGELDPFVRLAVRRATVALATTDQTAEKLRRLGCRRVSVVSQVGMTTSDEICRHSGSADCRGSDFRVVSVGRFLHWKGFELGVRAFALFRARFPRGEYWLIGDGPEKKRLEALARKLGLADRIRFLGSMARTQVLEKLAACDVLLNPSLHDSGSFVCIEAMAVGLPVICLDVGGPALQVTDETGIRVPALAPQQVVRDLAAAMNELATNHAVCARLGEGGRQRVKEHFNWDKKGEWMSRIYHSSINDFRQ